MTVKYLRRIREGDGFLIAACTQDYAEVTSSPFSSFEELKFAINNRVKIIPLRFDDIYPPEPGWGKDHAYDQEGISRDYINMAFPSSLAFIDCRQLSVEEIADALESRLMSDDTLSNFDSEEVDAGLHPHWQMRERALWELAPSDEDLCDIENDLTTRVHKARYDEVWQKQFGNKPPRHWLVLMPTTWRFAVWCTLCAIIGALDGFLSPLMMLVDPTFSLPLLRIMDGCSNFFWTLDVCSFVLFQLIFARRRERLFWRRSVSTGHLSHFYFCSWLSHGFPNVGPTLLVSKTTQAFEGPAASVGLTMNLLYDSHYTSWHCCQQRT
jgi:hypothetical protein